MGEREREDIIWKEGAIAHTRGFEYRGLVEVG